MSTASTRGVNNTAYTKSDVNARAAPTAMSRSLELCAVGFTITKTSTANRITVMTSNPQPYFSYLKLNSCAA